MNPVIAGLITGLLILQAGQAAFAGNVEDDMVNTPKEPQVGVKYMQPSKPGARPQPPKTKLPSEPTGPGKTENPKNPKDDPANQLNETSRPQ